MKSFTQFLTEGIDPKDLSVGDIVINSAGKKFKVTNLKARVKEDPPTAFLGRVWREADNKWGTVNVRIPYKFARKVK